jgi:hypothetical protein
MGKLQPDVPWRVDGPFMTASLATVGNEPEAKHRVDSNRYAARLITVGAVRLAPLITRYEIGHFWTTHFGLEREAVSACTVSTRTWITARSRSTSRRVSRQYSSGRPLLGPSCGGRSG